MNLRAMDNTESAILTFISAEEAKEALKQDTLETDLENLREIKIEIRKCRLCGEDAEFPSPIVESFGNSIVEWKEIHDSGFGG